MEPCITSRVQVLLRQNKRSIELTANEYCEMSMNKKKDARALLRDRLF